MRVEPAPWCAACSGFEGEAIPYSLVSTTLADSPNVKLRTCSFALVIGIEITCGEHVPSSIVSTLVTIGRGGACQLVPLLISNIFTVDNSLDVYRVWRTKPLHIYHLPLTIYHLPPTLYHLPPTIYRSLCFIDRLSNTGKWLGQIERLGQFGQVLGDQPTVVCTFRHGQSVAAVLEMNHRRVVAVVVLRQDQRHWDRNVLPNCQQFRPIGTDEHRLRAGLFQQRLSDLLSVDERFECRSVENLLCTVRLDRGGAMELHWASGCVQHQIPPE